jgi:hypothetical protein
MASDVTAEASENSTMSNIHPPNNEHSEVIELTNDRRDSAIQDPPTSKSTNITLNTTPNHQSLPTQPPLTTILCPSSLHPTTLPTTLLTTHSRLFATLAHDPSFHSSSPLNLNIDHDAFAVFARWLRNGPIHVPLGDENGFATDLYLLMRAHAAGEALGAGMFSDMVLDEIIGELVGGGSREVSEGEWYCRDDDERQSEKSLDSKVADARAKTHDLEILLQAAAAIWPPGSLGRDLLVDWYVHSSASELQNLSVEAVVEIGDLDLAARCMVLGKEKQMAIERGEVVRPPYLEDPCRYHEHRKLGMLCYKRSRESVYSRLEFAVRCGVGGWEDDDEDGDSGFGGEGATLEEYEACVEETVEVFGEDGEAMYD